MKAKSQEVTLPDFLCVGGAKCGTTSLYEYLRDHPKIFLPDQKELHYFSYSSLAARPNGPGMREVLKGLIATEDRYLKQFAKRRSGQIAGDFSPSYLNEESAMRSIYEFFGKDIKIIVLLRNPVDRIVSQYMHLRRAAREDLELSEALEQEQIRKAAGWGDMWLYRESAFAADRVQRYIDKFGRQNIHIILSDDLRKNPKESVKAVCNFLEIDPDFDFKENKEFNRSGLPKSRLIARIVDASLLATAAKRIFPRRFGAILKRTIQEFNTGEKQIISAELANKLSREYESEILQLEKIIGRKTHWI